MMRIIVLNAGNGKSQNAMTIIANTAPKDRRSHALRKMRNESHGKISC
jgi:hypothetical protein